MSKPEQAQPQEHTKNCTTCGSKIAFEAARCVHCGAKQ